VNFANAPARKAILDANNDGQFDAQDTELFLNAMYVAPDAGTVATTPAMT